MNLSINLGLHPRHPPPIKRRHFLNLFTTEFLYARLVGRAQEFPKLMPRNVIPLYYRPSAIEKRN